MSATKREAIRYQTLLIDYWIQQSNVNYVSHHSDLFWQILKKPVTATLHLQSLILLAKLQGIEFTISESSLGCLRGHLNSLYLPERRALETIDAISTVLSKDQFNSIVMILADKMYHSELLVRYLAIKIIKQNKHRINPAASTFIINRALDLLENKHSINQDPIIRKETSIRVLNTFGDMLDKEKKQTIIQSLMDKMSGNSEILSNYIFHFALFVEQMNDEQIQQFLLKIIARKDDESPIIRQKILKTLGRILHRLENEHFSKITDLVIEKLNDSCDVVKQEALCTYQKMFPRLDQAQFESSLPQVIDKLEMVSLRLPAVRILKLSRNRINQTVFSLNFQKFKSLLATSAVDCKLAILDCLCLFKDWIGTDQIEIILNIITNDFVGGNSKFRKLYHRGLIEFRNKMRPEFLQITIRNAIASLTNNDKNNLICSFQALRVFAQFLDDEQFPFACQQCIQLLKHSDNTVVLSSLKTLKAFSNKLQGSLLAEVNFAISQFNFLKTNFNFHEGIPILKTFSSKMSSLQVTSILNIALSQLQNMNYTLYEPALELISAVARKEHRQQLLEIMPKIIEMISSLISQNNMQISGSALHTLSVIFDLVDPNSQKIIIDSMYKSLSDQRPNIRAIALMKIRTLLFSGKINSQNFVVKPTSATTVEMVVATLLFSFYQTCTRLQPKVAEIDLLSQGFK